MGVFIANLSRIHSPFRSDSFCQTHWCIALNMLCATYVCFFFFVCDVKNHRDVALWMWFSGIYTFLSLLESRLFESLLDCLPLWIEPVWNNCFKQWNSNNYALIKCYKIMMKFMIFVVLYVHHTRPHMYMLHIYYTFSLLDELLSFLFKWLILKTRFHCFQRIIHLCK